MSVPLNNSLKCWNCFHLHRNGKKQEDVLKCIFLFRPGHKAIPPVPLHTPPAVPVLVIRRQRVVGLQRGNELTVITNTWRRCGFKSTIRSCERTLSASAPLIYFWTTFLQPSLLTNILDSRIFESPRL